MITETGRHIFNRQRLGEILLDRKLVNENQLDAALKSQKKEPDYVGKTLIKMGFVSEQDVMIALGIQCHLPYIAIDKCQVNKTIVSLIPKEYALRHHVMPLDKVGKILSVVVEAPLNDQMRNELFSLTHCQIASFVATRSEIERAISFWYD